MGRELVYFNEKEMMEFEKFLEERLKKNEEELKIVSSDDYIGWLVEFTSSQENKCWTNEDALYLFKGKDNKNGKILPTFMNYIIGLAKEQKVKNHTDKNNEFETNSYIIQIRDKYFRINRMQGQGCLDFIKEVSKPKCKCVIIK